LRDKLKLALNGTDVKQILHQKEGLILIDKKVRRNSKFPVGIQDVIEIPKMNMAYRVLYDSKGRFCFVPLKKKNEKDFKLCKI
jgi:small subunit ribosomal protein S4e